MISKNKIKYIRSLELKKNRMAERVFVAEGNKLVADMLPSYTCKLLLAKPNWMATQGDIPAEELLVAEIRKMYWPYSVIRNGNWRRQIHKRNWFYS